MSDQHRFIIKPSPIKNIAANDKNNGSRAVLSKHQKPLVAPFSVKWPDSYQLHQVINQHNECPDHHPAVRDTADTIGANRVYRWLLSMVTGLQVTGVTLLGWYLYDQRVAGPAYWGVEIFLILSSCFTLWWSARLIQSSTPQQLEDTEDVYDEDDFIIH